MSPGSAKSRLAAAAADLVETSGGVVLELVGSPFHTDAGLHPVRALLERRCGIGRLTDPAERLRLLDAEVRARGAGSGERGAVIGAGAWGSAPRHGYEPVPAEGRKLYELIAEAVHAICWRAWAAVRGCWWPKTCTGSTRRAWRCSARCSTPALVGCSWC